MAESLILRHANEIELEQACRPSLFKKSMKKYSVAWWAYSFPITFLALASTEYAKQIKGFVAPGLLMLLISAISVLVFLGLMLSTAFNLDRFLQENDDPIVSFTKNRCMKSMQNS